MFGRSSFGVSPPNTFGFGSGTSTTFGQPNQLFGSTSSTFGTGSSGFGSTSQPIFGNTQQNTAPLFGSTTTPAFGQSSQSSGFGSNLFGSTQQPSSSGGIFGSAAGTSFGQQNKPAGFGFPSSSSSGLFGQNTQTQQNAGSMFQPSSSSALFGSTSTFGGAPGPTGTVTKFVPVTGTDSVQKSGASQSINTKHYCITCMKEYENKSLEELRWEDYQANRKGQQQPAFGGPSQPFGIASTNSTLFGSTENKPIFGQSSTGFGHPNFSMAPQTTTSNMFGKSSTGFGNTTTTNSFVFGGTPTTGIFGTNTASKPFSAPANQSLFGGTQQQQQGVFGPPMFNQTNTSNSSNLFGKPAQQPGFNMGQSAFQFGTPQSNTSNIFQNQKPSTGIFGQTTTANVFGQPQQQSTFTGFNAFSKPVQPMFDLGAKNNSLFNNTSKSLFAPNNNLFTNTFQQSSGFNMQAQQPQQQPMLNMQAGNDQQTIGGNNVAQTGDPYGYNPHLDGLMPPKHQTSTYATDPKELRKYLEAPQPIAIVSPTTKKLKVFPPVIKKMHLFDEAVDRKTSEINFSLKSSAKRLNIRKESLLREPSDTSLVLNEGETGDGDLTLGSIHSRGPLFMSPIRLRKSGAMGDFSSSGILSTKTSSTQLTDLSEDDSPSKSENFNSSSTDILTPVEVHVSEGGDAPSNVEKTKEPPADTCGIILTRPEYYTVPPLEKLVEHRLGDGQCLVKGFTIGRVGYGNVSFPDLIDVGNLNLDELVHFRYRELTIYPDDTKKPPLGQGLNRRAQVTLDRVYPKGKVDRKLITDVDTLTAINFADTLRALCDKHGTRFLDYRPETGSWVFMVEHFSKYKYVDSDEDEDTDELDTQAKQNLKAQQPKEMVDKSGDEQPVQEMVLDDDDLMIEDSPMQTESMESEASDTQDVEPLETIDVEFTNIPSSDSLHQVKTRRELYKTTGSQLFLMKAALFEEEDYDPVSIEKDNIETIGKSRRLLKDAGRSTAVPARKPEEIDRKKPRVFVLQNKLCTVPMNMSFYSCRNYMDVALYKSRSFKVGWGKGLTLAMPWNGLETTVAHPSVRNRIQILDMSKLIRIDPLLDSLPGHLGIVLDTSDISLVQGIPFCKVKHSKEALARHQHLAHQIYTRDPLKRNLSYYKETWDLIVALWRDIPADVARREELSKWFQEVLAKEVHEILNKFIGISRDMIFKEIFVRLTGFQLHEAADLAVKNSIPKLALLISQMNLSTATKPILQYQMEQWKSSMAMDFIPTIVQKIYMLLSGILIYEYESKNFRRTVNVCEYLNWRQCFSIILWYMTSSSDNISTSFYLYKEAFEKHSICMRPTPDHLDEGTEIFDVQYYLLMLHCNKSVSLEKVLDPLTHTIYGADYRLSWLLLQTLTALNVGVLNEEGRVVVATTFSIQLESLGFPKWAVFPLLFIKDPTVRRNLIMSSLHRNLESKIGDLTEKDLVKKLLVPPEWMHEIKAYRAQLLSMHWQNYQHLSYTNLWYEAHKIAIEHLIPELIVNERFDLIKNILRSLKKGRKHICNWSSQGGLLLDFFHIAKGCNKPEMSRNEALHAHSALLEIITKLPFYPMETPKQIAAVSELSKRCYIFAKSLIHIIKPTYRGIIAVTTMKLDRLIMPADYIFQDLQSLSLKA